MNVSELARGAGLSPSGVRWYETVGVLPAAPRRDNGYREYSADDLRLLQLVTTLRRVGLSPKEAGRLARLCLDRGAVDQEVLATLNEQRRAIARQRQQLDRLESELADLEATVAATRPARMAPGEAPIAVLFLCNSNSGRSQMAEALLARDGGLFAAHSAGIAPREVSPFAVRALADVGIDWSDARAKSVGDLGRRAFEYVITLSDSAREQCPKLPGPHNSLHWRLADPAETTGTEDVRLEAYRRTRDEIILRLRPFIELAAQTAGLPSRSNWLKETSHG